MEGLWGFGALSAWGQKRLMMGSRAGTARDDL